MSKRMLGQVFRHDNRFHFCLLFFYGIVTIFLLVAAASGSSCQRGLEHAYLERVAAHERDLGLPASWYIHSIKMCSGSLVLRRKDLTSSVDQMALGLMAVEAFPAFPPFTLPLYLLTKHAFFFFFVNGWLLFTCDLKVSLTLQQSHLNTLIIVSHLAVDLELLGNAQTSGCLNPFGWIHL